MKRKLLPLVIAGLASGHAAADVTVYGKVNVSANALDTETTAGTEDETHTEINSNSSRLGVKGGYKLGEGSTKAIFKLEYEVAVDDGDADGDEFKQRNIYGGFTGDWGTLIVGRHDTPLKLAQGKVDRFNDLKLGDVKNMLVGDDRVSNIAIYSTPKMAGLTASIAMQSGESDKNDDAFSGIVQYEASDFRLAVAQNFGVNSTDTTRLVAEYAGDNFKVGGLFQVAEEEETAGGIGDIKGPAAEYGVDFDEQTGYLLSGEVGIAKNVKLKAQFAMAENDVVASNASVDTLQYALGVDYALNKQAKLFAYYAAIEAEVDNGTPTTDQTDATLGAGFEIKF